MLLQNPLKVGENFPTSIGIFLSGLEIIFAAIKCLNSARRIRERAMKWSEFKIILASRTFCKTFLLMNI